MIHDLFFHVVGRAPSKKIVWLTDLHLDAAEKGRIAEFKEELSAHEPDLLLIGGDTSNGIRALGRIREMADWVKCPVYFVLGNHDFYYHSVREMRIRAGKLATHWERVTYLTRAGVVELLPEVALIGHDGWADGRAGDFLHSEIMLHDYLLIKELKGLSSTKRLEKLHAFGTEAAEALRSSLSEAFASYEQAILLTHTPPFVEVCLFEGRGSNDQWAPHFVCQAMGEMLREEMAKVPEKRLLVLCGHSHYGADKQMLPNVRVLVGHSQLGTPSIQGLIHI